MAAPFFSTPFQPYVYQSQQSVATPFQILGGEAQVLQIMLKSQEKVTAKPGTMCYMSGSVQINNIYFPEHEGGVWQWLFGKSITTIVFTNAGPDDGFVGISAPSPARILPPDAFLCSLNDVTISNTMDQRPRNIASGVEVILKQKLVGQGLAFLVGGGSVVQKVLEAEEVVVVDAACLVAMTTTINSQVKYSHPVRRAVFGGDYQLTVSLTGPGIVFIQSLPFHRLSQRIARAVTPPGMRENPKFFIQIAIFFFLAYVMIVSSLILTDV
ncbi:uncharacterized protein LOC110032875 isoform X2 [Phalaenopsis equestris]|uniref:uncharacterized protein LOC110032875 isoform X2 n=1 Tax=Phalaenopsis equestris TaxID=78828 RepID=UPI0009E23C7F|nr:uncharacterized protein LOC110032875 isoform X2 [Phalaenopsis equestris]